MNKKLLLGLGSIPLVALPIASIVSCSSSDGGSESKIDQNTLVSNVNPQAEIEEFKSINSYSDLLDFNENYISKETLLEISKFKGNGTGVGDPTVSAPTEISYDDFDIFSSGIYNGLNIDQIKKNAVTHDLSNGYDFKIKKRFLLGRASTLQNKEVYPLFVLVQLTKDGKEILGADFYIKLNDYQVVKNINNSSSTPSLPQPSPSDQDKLNWIIKLINSTLNDKFDKWTSTLPKKIELDETNFSAFEWKIRKIAGIKNDEFSKSKDIDIESINIINNYNDGLYIPTKFEDKLDFINADLIYDNNNNSISVQMDSFNKNSVEELVKALKTFKNELLTIVGKNLLTHKTLLAITNKLIETKNKELFKSFDGIINAIISTTSKRKSQPIYRLKSSEITNSRVPGIKKSLIIKKSEINSLLESNVTDIIFDENKKISWNKLSLEDYIININNYLDRHKLSKIDLNNNKIKYIAYNNTGKNLFEEPYENIEALKELSKQNYNEQIWLKVKNIIDIDKSLYLSNNWKIKSLGENDSTINPRFAKPVEFEIEILDDININNNNANVEYVSDDKYLVEKSTGKIVKYLLDKNPTTPVELNIPYEINGVTIREIGDKVFENVTNIKSITLPSSLEWIGNSSFRYIKFDQASTPENRKIIIPNSVKFIGERAFNIADIHALEFKDLKSYIVIEKNAFRGNKFSEVKLPAAAKYVVSNDGSDDSFDKGVAISKHSK